MKLIDAYLLHNKDYKVIYSFHSSLYDVDLITAGFFKDENRSCIGMYNFDCTIDFKQHYRHFLRKAVVDKDSL